MSAQAIPVPEVNLRRILLVLFVGVFMAALDTAIIAPAIPALQAAFNVDTRQIALITVIYLLGLLSSNALMANLAEQRGRALGLIGATFGMAFIIGPLVASAMLVALSWQWLFLINLPVAALILVLGVRNLSATRSTDKQPPFDFAGLLTVITHRTS